MIDEYRFGSLDTLVNSAAGNFLSTPVAPKPRAYSLEPIA